MYKIDFSNLNRKETPFIFSGKIKGRNTRAYFDLDKLEKSGDVISVKIPDTVRVLAPSFVSGFLSKSIIDSGSVDEFFKQYEFVCSEGIKEQIYKSVLSCLETETALEKAF